MNWKNILLKYEIGELNSSHFTRTISIDFDVSGANPQIKKWSRGNGTKLTASFLKSVFNWPENLSEHVAHS
jgi:hypothetical protein